MKSVIYALCFLSISSHAKADFTYDEAKTQACFQSVKAAILAGTNSQNVRMGISTRSDGFTNILATYTNDYGTFMSVIYINANTEYCPSISLFTGVPLFTDRTQHRSMLRQSFPACLTSDDSIDWLFTTPDPRAASTVVQAEGHLFQLATWEGNSPAERVAVFRSVFCGANGGSSVGEEVKTLPAESIRGLNCSRSSCVVHD